MPRPPAPPAPSGSGGAPTAQRGAGDTGRSRHGRAEPRLPHEHDESADSQRGTPDPVIEQAARDIADGIVDTDRGPVADRAYQRQKRP